MRQRLRVPREESAGRRLMPLHELRDRLLLGGIWPPHGPATRAPRRKTTVEPSIRWAFKGVVTTTESAGVAGRSTDSTWMFR
jgi:hypothetical protein